MKITKLKDYQPKPIDRQRAMQEYAEVLYEWNLPPLNKKEYEEYLSSRMYDHFYTPLGWSGFIKKKVRNWNEQ